MESEEKTLSYKPIQVCLVLLIVLAFFNVWTSFRTPLSDFGNYYYGARLVEEGNPAGMAYDVFFFNNFAQQEGAKGLFLNHCTVTPQTALIYQPFAWISNAYLSKTIFNAISILIFCFVLFRFLRKFAPLVSTGQCILLVATLIPMYYNILFGQTYLLVAALLMECVVSMDDRKWLSGLCLAVAIALKISPAVLFVWLLAERRFAIVGWTVAIWAILTAITALLFTGMWHQLVVFYTEYFPRLSHGYVSDPFSSSFQGFVVFLRKLMLPDAVLNPGPLIHGNEQLVQLFNTFFFILISLVVVGAWKRNMEWKQKILLLLLMMNITSGYSSTYSLLMLVPFITVENSIRGWIRIILYAVIFLMPPRIFDGGGAFLEEYKLWIFIAVFILEVEPTFNLRFIDRQQTFICVFFVFLVINRIAQRPENLPLEYYRPDVAKQSFLFQAFPMDQSVAYISYADNGFRQFTIPMDRQWKPESDAHRIHGINFRIIGSDENNYLVLSDYHRGPGLFHLYTISKREFAAIAQ